MLNMMSRINPLNAELNSICHLLAFAAAPYIYDISRLRVKPQAIMSFFFVGVRIRENNSHVINDI
jgi:hypothetical protein